MIKKQNLWECGHVSKSSGSTNTIRQGTVKIKIGEKADRRRGWNAILKSEREYNIKEWTGMDLTSLVRAPKTVQGERDCCAVICVGPTILQGYDTEWNSSIDGHFL